VWFGEQLPEDAIERAHAALAKCDLFFSIGTSAVVYPVAGFFELARAQGAKLVEINNDETPISHLMHWSLRGRAGEILPALVTSF